MNLEKVKVCLEDRAEEEGQKGTGREKGEIALTTLPGCSDVLGRFGAS